MVLPNAPTIDLAGIVETAGAGVQGASAGWAIFIGAEQEVPNTVITFFDTGGDPANAKFLLDFPTVQVRIRGNINGYEEAYNKAREVKDILHALPSQDINNTRYVGVWLVSDIIHLDRDISNRPRFVLNWRIIRQPDIGANRVSL